MVSPIAETTTTTSSPALRAVTMRSATRLMRSASATDEPPYFCTISATASPPIDARTVPDRGTERTGASGRRREWRSHDPTAPVPDNGRVSARHVRLRGSSAIRRAWLSRDGCARRGARRRASALAGLRCRRRAAPERRPRRRRPAAAARGRAARRPRRAASPRPRTAGSSAAYTLDGRRRADRTVTVTLAADGTWRVDIPGGALGRPADVVDGRPRRGRVPVLLGRRRAASGWPAAGAAPCRSGRSTRRCSTCSPTGSTALVDRARRALGGAAPAAARRRPAPASRWSRPRSSIAPPIDPGIYCYGDDGMLTGVRTRFGTLTLAGPPGAGPADGGTGRPGGQRRPADARRAATRRRRPRRARHRRLTLVPTKRDRGLRDRRPDHVACQRVMWQALLLALPRRGPIRPAPRRGVDARRLRSWPVARSPVNLLTSPS